MRQLVNESIVSFAPAHGRRSAEGILSRHLDMIGRRPVIGAVTAMLDPGTRSVSCWLRRGS